MFINYLKSYFPSILIFILFLYKGLGISSDSDGIDYFVNFITWTLYYYHLFLWCSSAIILIISFCVLFFGNATCSVKQKHNFTTKVSGLFFTCFFILLNSFAIAYANYPVHAIVYFISSFFCVVLLEAIAVLLKDKLK